MIGLFKVKEKQREQAQNASRGGGGGGGASVKKQSAGELRLHKDISELNLPTSCTISFPNGKDDLMNFEVSIKPDDGYYHNGTFAFTFHVYPVYPHEALKVECKTKEPNSEDPLNDEAAQVLRDNPKLKPLYPPLYFSYSQRTLVCLFLLL
ncbi:NEDD8-conjugating enzyme Ubc12-like isoform X2 [Brassica napus]|uniref:NEDD8-conjugating enzyme Ubc12-like isoform X2 n=1 Tax=Brassica napus TaxID=3708 RepID=UPI0020786E87|nr:NEDD8-conjugating enzyme Ubc12-like isoform X2 [Brassica napus]XP_048592200.1 NEDD8-conjugating enzyme Ubc12-like isoform X2 [Brassica napus]